MSGCHGRRQANCWILTLVLVLSAALPCAASSTQSKKVASRRSTGAGDSAPAGLVRPQLLNGDSDPVLRFPVMSMPSSVFSITYGWLDISRNAVRYSVVEPSKKSEHSFEVGRLAVRELKFNSTFLTFRSPAQRQVVVYLPQQSWGSVHSGPGSYSAAGRGALGTGSIYQALVNFDQMLAAVKPPAPQPVPVAASPVAPPAPEPKPVPPPAPPAIMLAAPAGAGANQVVETQESPLVIRGVAMDNTGMPVVTINGAAANMRPQNAQAVEFWTEPMPLDPGGNRFEIAASNTAHIESKLVFLVHYKPRAAPPNPRALGKPEVLSLLQGGVVSARIVEIVKERGVKFVPTADDIADIRAAGGADDLIEAVEKASLQP